MEFNPSNSVIKLCVQGMEMEEKGNPAEAGRLFLRAWEEATNDFEKFIAAFYVARQQNTSGDKLKWYETALHLGLQINDENVRSAFPSLYSNIAHCYQDLGDMEKAKQNNELALSLRGQLSDKGPFYHGTKAGLEVGDLLTPGNRSNYKEGIIMNHIYFTALVNGAALAAALAKGDGPGHVYIVEPTGEYESDPNLTDKKFPGNLTRSYRTAAPLKIIGELTGWEKLTPGELGKWREKLNNSKGEIIN